MSLICCLKSDHSWKESWKSKSKSLVMFNSSPDCFSHAFSFSLMSFPSNSGPINSLQLCCLLSFPFSSLVFNNSLTQSNNSCFVCCKIFLDFTTFELGFEQTSSSKFHKEADSRESSVIFLAWVMVLLDWFSSCSTETGLICSLSSCSTEAACYNLNN